MVNEKHSIMVVTLINGWFDAYPDQKLEDLIIPYL